MRIRTHLRRLPSAFLLLVLSLPGSAARAQDSALPSAGSWALGGDVGFAEPLGGSEFDSQLQGDLFFEYFQTSQVSWRGMLSFFQFDAPDDGDVDLLALNANATYQWDGKSILPYLTGGVGLYRVDPARARADAKLEFGADFGAGVNFYVSQSKKLAIKLEGVFHGTSGEEPDSFFLVTVGVKGHF